MGACTTEVVTWEEPPASDIPSRPDDENADDGDGSDDDAGLPGPTSREVTGIPLGQMPPPGGCRIWHPDRSPGQQPPPGLCAALSERTPEDAWLLYRPTDAPRVYRID